jgi:hypothetical protein
MILLIGLNLLHSDHFLRLPIITQQIEPIAQWVKQAILQTEKVIHIQRDGHEGHRIQENPRRIAIVQLRTIDDQNEEKVCIQSRDCIDI